MVLLYPITFTIIIIIITNYKICFVYNYGDEGMLPKQHAPMCGGSQVETTPKNRYLLRTRQNMIKVIYMCMRKEKMEPAQ